MADFEEPRKAFDLMAEQVRVARARRRWSQEEVARRAGVDRARVSEFENGNADPRLSTITRIGEALGLSLRFNEDAA